MSNEAPASMPEFQVTMGRRWWMPVVRGVALVLLGLASLVAPLNTLTAIVFVLGVFAVLDGIITLVQAFAHRKELGAGWILAQGGISLVFGIVIMVWPHATIGVLFYTFALWVLVLGVFAIVAAIYRFRARDLNWTWMLVFGVVGTVIGLLMLGNGSTTLTAFIIIYGLFALIGGVVLIISGVVARQIGGQQNRRDQSEHDVIEG